MAIRSVDQKHVSVRPVLRTSLKRQSKRAKVLKATKKSSHAARSLITRATLAQSARVIHIPTARHVASSRQKSKKNRSNAKGKLGEVPNSDQASIPDKRCQHGHTPAKRQEENRDPERPVRIADAETQRHSTKLDHHHHPEAINSKPSSNLQHNAHSTAHKTSSDPIDHYIPVSTSLPPSNRKSASLLHAPAVASNSLSALVRSNKKSLVHPEYEQQNQLSSEKKKKKKKRISPLKIVLISSLAGLVITGIVLAIVMPIIFNKNKPTAAPTNSSPTLSAVCSASNSTPCSTVIHYDLNSAFAVPPLWMSVSCCYIAPTVNQSTIEFAFRADTGGWMIDDVSVTQGNRELISNGGFESGMSNWTWTVYANATSSTVVDSVSNTQLTGIAYLYGASAGASDYVRQTFPLTPGQNALISFWWNYIPSLGGGSGVSELTVTLI